MKSKLAALGAACAVACVPAVAAAQSYPQAPGPAGSNVSPQSQLVFIQACNGGLGGFVGVTYPVGGECLMPGGGGVGGAVTATNGAITPLGNTTDAACPATDTTSEALVCLIKETNQLLQGFQNSTAASATKEQDSSGGDATDTTNHAVKINCVIGCSGGSTIITGNGQASLNEAATTSTSPVANQLIAGVAGKSIYVTGVNLTMTLGEAVQFEYGTGTACGTGTTLIGAPLYLGNATTNGGIVQGSGAANIMAPIPQGDSLCVVNTPMSASSTLFAANVLDVQQ